jgi:hypothetical protein
MLLLPYWLKFLGCAIIGLKYVEKSFKKSATDKSQQGILKGEVSLYH